MENKVRKSEEDKLADREEGQERRGGRVKGIIRGMVVLVIPARPPDLHPVPHLAWSPARNQTDPSFRDPCDTPTKTW